MSSFNLTLSIRVKEARGNKSLREFAKLCGISHTHLDSIEKGFDPRTGKPVSVSWDTLVKLSKGSGLSINYLVGDTDKPYSGTIYLLNGEHYENVLTEKEQLAKLRREASAEMTPTEAAIAYFYSKKGRNPTEEELEMFIAFTKPVLDSLPDKKD